jgi:hypothetical protein
MCSRAISSASSRRRTLVTASISGISTLHQAPSWVISMSKRRAGPSRVAWLGKNLACSAWRRRSSSNCSSFLGDYPPQFVHLTVVPRGLQCSGVVGYLVLEPATLLVEHCLVVLGLAQLGGLHKSNDLRGGHPKHVIRTSRRVSGPQQIAATVHPLPGSHECAAATSWCPGPPLVGSHRVGGPRAHVVAIPS